MVGWKGGRRGGEGGGGEGRVGCWLTVGKGSEVDWTIGTEVWVSLL